MNKKNAFIVEAQLQGNMVLEMKNKGINVWLSPEYLQAHLNILGFNKRSSRLVIIKPLAII